MQSRLDRFQGPTGARNCLEEIRRQKLVDGDPKLAKAFCSEATIKNYGPEGFLIRQGDVTTDIFLILAGKVAVIRNNRQIAERKAGDHVGEMATIDCRQKRCASVMALEETVVAQLSEAQFSKLADKWPSLWRTLAMEALERHRERLLAVRTRNEVPIAFVGSSTESLPVAELVERALSTTAEVRTWTRGVFTADQFTLESLENQAALADFAVMVFARDDKVFSRGRASAAPRDNVVFELGLFMGQLGHKRAFVIKPKGQSLKIPTDLLGKNDIEYLAQPIRDLDARVSDACGELVDIIKREGAR